MVADGIRIRQEWMLQIVGPTIRAEWEIQLDDDVSSSIQHKHPVIMFQSLTHSLIILIIQSFIHSTFCFLQIFILRSLFELNVLKPVTSDFDWDALLISTKPFILSMPHHRTQINVKVFDEMPYLGWGK